MDKLAESLLLRILSQLNDSADVARCRVASKAFDTVSPGLRSLNLRCSKNWYVTSSSRASNSSNFRYIKPFKTVFLDLISKLEAVESVCVGNKGPIIGDEYFNVTDEDFATEWLPRVSGSLKSLSVFKHWDEDLHPSNILLLISAYCHNLVNLKLKGAWLSVNNLNSMPLLTSLTLESMELEDEHLIEFNECLPNLQVLKLVDVRGLKYSKIHLLNLKACIWTIYSCLASLTLITPNLITLRIECLEPAALHVEAPMLSHFHLGLNPLKTLDNFIVHFMNSQYPVENLTLDSADKTPRVVRDSKFILEKVFKVFPNVSSLCIDSGAWSELEACLNPEGWESLDGTKGLKTICAYLMMFDPSLTFASLACVLDQCVGLSEVSLLIHDDGVGPVSQSFMSRCIARWPWLKWRWGVWSDDMDDSWIVDGTRVVDELNENKRWFVPVRSFKFNRTNKRKRPFPRMTRRVRSFKKFDCLCLDKTT